MSERYDVIIIGTGPAGIFSALELVKRQGLKVLMLEKGGDIRSRSCPMMDARRSLRPVRALRHPLRLGRGQGRTVTAN